MCTPEPLRANAPAVLLIHGGGWHEGHRAAYARQCKSFAQMGIVAVPVEYRLTSPGPGDATWPDQFDDVQLAMRWVRAHAAHYGIDPAHICAEGDSAGGQLALMLDVVTTIEPGDMQALLKDVSPHADCAISISGPSDMVALAPVLRGPVNQLIGTDDPQRMRALLEDASPAMRVRKGAGPALLIQGLDDPAVPLDQAITMQAAMSRVGVPAWLVSHVGGHEMHGLTPSQVQGVWPLIADFVKNPRLPGPPRELPIDELLH